MLRFYRDVRCWHNSMLGKMMRMSGHLCGAPHSGGRPPEPRGYRNTAWIMRAANIIQIPVLDHVIVTRDALVYHSMFGRGTLPNVPSDG